MMTHKTSLLNTHSKSSDILKRHKCPVAQPTLPSKKKDPETDMKNATQTPRYAQPKVTPAR
jgi:hypothetical protein